MSIPNQPMDEGQVFHPSSAETPLRQQVIALSQTYPCPRCTSGILEPYGHTETMQCTNCHRSFVPLKGGRLLYPSNSLGWKIAPTFWWDGFRWHWGGTTATTRQLSMIVLFSLLPAISIFMAHHMYATTWNALMPRWCDPVIFSPIVGLLTMQILYLMCWDFDFCKQKSRKA